jgi:hypothetical protein
LIIRTITQIILYTTWYLNFVCGADVRERCFTIPLYRGDETEEGNDSSEWFSAREAGGDVAESAGLDTAGEEDEEDMEGEAMDLL